MVDHPSVLKNNYKAYKELFFFENNLRSFIKSELLNKYQDNWQTTIPVSLQKKITEYKDKNIKYIAPEYLNSNELSYLFLSELRAIIVQFWEDIFYNHFSNLNKEKNRAKTILTEKFFELELIRNSLAHFHMITIDQLKTIDANIAFFKTYIPTQNIFEKNPSLVDTNINGTVDLIVSTINSFQNISADKIDIIKQLNNTLYKDLLLYNRIPKTKNKFENIQEFIRTNNIIDNLTILKVYHV